MHHVQIQCPRCKNKFRDSALRLQSGYSRQCPGCEVVLFFDEDSQNPFVKQTMREARRVRKQLREAEAAQMAASTLMDANSDSDTETQTETFSRSFAGRSRSRARSS